MRSTSAIDGLETDHLDETVHFVIGSANESHSFEIRVAKAELGAEQRLAVLLLPVTCIV